jgi:hypothetical protein
MPVARYGRVVSAELWPPGPASVSPSTTMTGCKGRGPSPLVPATPMSRTPLAGANSRSAATPSLDAEAVTLDVHAA